MDYLVIELEEQPRILCDLFFIPIIFKTKQDAFREADKCKKGLVYPVYNIMGTLEAIKLKYREGNWNSDRDFVKEILTLLDEIL